MEDPALGIGAYLAGVLWLSIVVGSLAIAGLSVRRAYLAQWTGLSALLAQLTVALALFTLVGELLGSAGMLRAVPVAAGVVLASLAVTAIVHRSEPEAGGARLAGGAASPRWERWLATAAVAAVGAQWAAHTAHALRAGMTHPDTLWYHSPFSARFLQLASLGDLEGLGYSQARYYPLGSEVLHALVALPFDRDLLSPAVNLGFGALAVLAAAVIGRRWGAGAMAVLGIAAVLALPALAGTQPGQASNDVIAIALVLAAVALALEGEDDAPPMALGGLALGLAAGTKMTVLALCGPMAVVVFVAAWRRGARSPATWWLAGVLIPAVFWPLRNLVLTGTPVPFLDFHVFGWHHAARTSTAGTPSLARTLLDGSDWSLTGGAANGLGSAWPVALLLLVGAPLAFLRGPAVLRWIAGATIVAGLAYPFTPFTGGSSFQYNLRYLMPALALSTVLLVVAGRTPRWLRGSVTAVLALLLVTALLADHHERVDAWPGHWAVVAATVVLVVGVALAGRLPRGGRSVWPAVAAAAGIVSLLGWPLQRSYLERRYVATGLHDDAAHAILQTTSGQRVDVLGTWETYPMFGADLSNRVHGHDDDLLLSAPPPTDPCRYWRRELRDADLIVVSRFGFAMRHLTPEERRSILESDPAVSVLYSDDERAVYRVDGTLDPDGC